MPFDILGLVVYVGLYLIGLVVLIVAAVVSGNKTTGSILLAYILVPLVLIGVATGVTKFERSRHDEAIAEGKAQNLDAYGKYCKERGERAPVIHERAVIDPDAALMVRLEKYHTDAGLMRFPGYAIAEIMWGRSDLRRQSGVRYTEDLGTKRVLVSGFCEAKSCWSVEGNGTSHKSVVRSRYELILGENGSSTHAPWPENHMLQLSKSSVRIVDRLTDKTLAEDMLYFLDGDTGLGVCPYAPEQLAKLLSDIFGPEEH